MRTLRVGLVCGELDPVRDGGADYTRQLARSLHAIGVDALPLTTYRLAEAAGDPAVGDTDSWAGRGIRRGGRGRPPRGPGALGAERAPPGVPVSRRGCAR